MYMRPTTCAVLEIQYNDGDEKKTFFHFDDILR